MFIASIAQSLVQQQYFHLSSMMGMSIFQSLSASIYHKVLVPKSQRNETNEVHTQRTGSLVAPNSDIIVIGCQPGA